MTARQSDDLAVEHGLDNVGTLVEKDSLTELDARQVRVVGLDLPTSWALTTGDEFTKRMFAAVNGMMLDVLAAVARKDYEDQGWRVMERHPGGDGLLAHDHS